jgi:hypothetical protein
MTAADQSAAWAMSDTRVTVRSIEDVSPGSASVREPAYSGRRVRERGAFLLMERRPGRSRVSCEKGLLALDLSHTDTPRSHPRKPER